MLGGGVEEDLLGQGKDADTYGANSSDQVDHVLALILVIGLQQLKLEKYIFLILLAREKSHIIDPDLLPGAAGHAHLINAGPGPVGDSLAPPGDHHEARAGEEGAGDHNDCEGK